MDYVGGVAQLANYEGYFTYPLNASRAKEKYSIKVGSPKIGF